MCEGGAPWASLSMCTHTKLFMALECFPRQPWSRLGTRLGPGLAWGKWPRKARASAQGPDGLCFLPSSPGSLTQYRPRPELPVVAAVPGPCPLGVPGSSQKSQLPATAPLRGTCGSDGWRAQASSDPPGPQRWNPAERPLPMAVMAREAYTARGERRVFPSAGWHTGLTPGC